MTPLQNKSQNKGHIGFLGVMTALAMIFSYIEVLIPFNFGIPGIKLGVANICVLICLFYLGPKDAFIISILRVILVGFLFGNLFSVLYSLSGAILSFIVMYILYRLKKLHIITISICGAIAHNMGQLFIACMLLSTYKISYYFPVLYIAGAVTGFIIGLVSFEVLKRIKYFKMEDV